MTYLLLIIGFALLVKGADFFVEGASRIASRLRVSPLLIGLTIVAFGTSAPEASVSLLAAIEGSADVAIGNVVGSSIFNITFIVGLAALVFPMPVQSETVRKEIPFALLAAVSLVVVVSDLALQNGPANLLSRTEGIVLLLFFSIFLYYVFEVARNSREQLEIDETYATATSWTKNLLFTIGGLGGIVYGGSLVVDSSTEIALSLGMSQTLVGLTIVAIGTSLPELVTSVTAALKKQTDLALGNVIGSNIFNLFFVLGASAVVHPLAVDDRIFMDIGLLIFVTLLLLILSRTHYKLTRGEGAVLAGIYTVYLVLIILRN